MRSSTAAVGRRHRFVAKLVVTTALAAFLLPLGTASASAETPEPQDVNLKLLEQQTFDAINSIRTDPRGAAQTLISMRDNSKPVKVEGGGSYITMTLPDGTVMSPQRTTYVESAITKLQSMEPVSAHILVPALAKTAKLYAQKNPNGHFADQTPTARAARQGLIGSVGESINYAGTTGWDNAFDLFIDTDVPNLGHRTMITNPGGIYAGVGCDFPQPSGNKYGHITCVMNMMDTWTEPQDELVVQSGKQYALPLSDGKTFAYIRMVDLGPQRGKYVFPACAGKNTNIQKYTGSSLQLLTTVDQAKAKGLTAINEPCDDTGTKNGTLKNGTGLPTGGPGSLGKTTAATATTDTAKQPSTQTTVETRSLKPEVGKAYLYKAGGYWYAARVDAIGREFVFSKCTIAGYNGSFTIPGPVLPPDLYKSYAEVFGNVDESKAGFGRGSGPCPDAPWGA